MEGELLEFHDFLLSGAPYEKSPGDFSGAYEWCRHFPGTAVVWWLKLVTGDSKSVTRDWDSGI
jgi:hypothetical protein